jgi:Acyl-CoA thioesterase C-terminal domain/Acyl-CoA thioesterase N-terminal domain
VCPGVSAGSVYVGRDGRLVATELSRGPWDANAQHGGAPAALLMREFERCAGADGLSIARATYEFLRPIPLGELEVRASVTRPGRRVQLLEGSIFDPGGVELVRARALRVAPADADGVTTPEPAPPPGPEHGRPDDPRPPHGLAMFAPDAIEVRFVEGQFGQGPAAAWFRLRHPLVAGESPSPLQRLAAAGDFGNGISAVLSWDEYMFINPDLTLYVDRVPEGEWICLRSQTTLTPGGIGTAESLLFDQRGRVGRATQALLVARRR